MQTVLSAFYDSQALAETAIAGLRTGGIPDTAISVIGSDGAPHAADGDKVVGSHVEGDRVVNTDGDELLTKAGETHALRGVLGGGALGALLGAAAIPVAGPFLAAGAIVAAATGFILGASVGGIAEIMTHHGIAEADAAYYEQRLKAGGVIVSVVSTTPMEAARIDGILKETGGMRAGWDAAHPSYVAPVEPAIA